MKTITQRNIAHPWNYYKAMCEKMKKHLTSQSNENLDALLGQANLTAFQRSDKIAVLMEEFERNYHTEFEAMHGFPLEDTQDPKKFRKHFRKFKRQTKRRLFIGRVALALQTILPPWKKNRK